VFMVGLCGVFGLLFCSYLVCLLLFLNEAINDKLRSEKIR